MSVFLKELRLSIRHALRKSDDLRKTDWRGMSNPMAGHCYIASEVLYHILGGKASGWKPKTLRINGVTHWFLESSKGAVLDVTADQFDFELPYWDARGRGFLTKQLSKRAAELKKRMEYDDPSTLV